MREELKPCPFCGGTAEVYCDREMGGSQYRIKCTNGSGYMERFT